VFSQSKETGFLITSLWQGCSKNTRILQMNATIVYMLYNHPDNVLVNQKASLLPAIIIVAAVVCLMFLYKLYH